MSTAETTESEATAAADMASKSKEADGVEQKPASHDVAASDDDKKTQNGECEKKEEDTDSAETEKTEDDVSEEQPAPTSSTIAENAEDAAAASPCLDEASKAAAVDDAASEAADDNSSPEADDDSRVKKAEDDEEEDEKKEPEAEVEKDETKGEEDEQEDSGSKTESAPPSSEEGKKLETGSGDIEESIGEPVKPDSSEKEKVQPVEPAAAVEKVPAEVQKSNAANPAAQRQPAPAEKKMAEVSSAAAAVVVARRGPAAVVSKEPYKPVFTEILADKGLNDEQKFAQFKELIEQGKMSNKEVVDSVLHLVSPIHTQICI